MQYSDLAEIVNENESLQFLQGMSFKGSKRFWMYCCRKDLCYLLFQINFN